MVGEPIPNNTPAAVPEPSLLPVAPDRARPAVVLHLPLMLVGSGASAYLSLPSPDVDDPHALLIKSGSRFYIHDLASRTHVLVNGAKIREHLLAEGDLLQIGPFVFKFSCPPGWPLALPQKAPPVDLRIPDLPDPLRIGSRVILIGRHPACDVRLPHENVSPAHAAIVDLNGTRWLCDLNSSSGVLVNGIPVRQVELNAHDVIRIGATDIRYTPAPQAPIRPQPAASVDAFFEVGDGQMLSLGGMPLQLQDVAAPPAHFGRVQVVFHEESAQPTPPPVLPAAPTPRTAAAHIIELPQNEPEEPGEELLESRWDPARKIKTPPPARYV